MCAAWGTVVWERVFPGCASYKGGTPSKKKPPDTGGSCFNNSGGSHLTKDRTPNFFFSEDCLELKSGGSTASRCSAIQCPSYERWVFQIQDFAQSFGSLPFWSWWQQMEAEAKVASHGRNLWEANRLPHRSSHLQRWRLGRGNGQVGQNKRWLQLSGQHFKKCSHQILRQQRVACFLRRKKRVCCWGWDGFSCSYKGANKIIASYSGGYNLLLRRFHVIFKQKNEVKVKPLI